ncbi:tetratricopeptide repeat protein [Hymenobacter psychrotolerans]|uniref:TPR repeat-containing protein n=1 Tax=Hymenobacter psychrotolerans DSM 18569 TaxID=1121959 RepID=A0A1M6QDW9_9BACT|nr:tetratricopeptide repeat protein [Hymenobacter psychrotolerans]SHK18449.1 TPR repeat-containing protein [Hymenobacter psychrotolerans DSM 18569]
MLHRYLLFLLLLAAVPGQAQTSKTAAATATEAEVLRKATELMQDRQYESAWKLLNGFDPKHRRPAVALKQTELALNYHLRSRELEGFGFVDLKPLERLDSLRAKYTRAAIRYPFAVELVLKNLLKQQPGNYKLNRALADYYFQVEQCQCAEADKSPATLYALMARHYTIAHQHGQGDYSSYYKLGYARMSQTRFTESLPLFQRSIKLRPDYAPAHFHLAYSYTELKKLRPALEEARTAARLADTPELKYDANFVASELERRLGIPSSTPKPEPTNKP